MSKAEELEEIEEQDTEEVEVDDEEQELEGMSDEDTSESDESVDEEDPVIPIHFIDDRGEEKVEELKYSQLGDLVKDYSKAHQIIQQYNEYYQQTLPIVNVLQNSRLLQSVLYYKGQGYTDEQIIEGLFSQWQSSANQGAGKQNEQPANLEAQLAAMVARELDKRVKPIEEQSKLLQNTAYLQSVESHNNKILEEVLREHNIAEITQPELTQMGEFLAEMYPGIDLRYLKLTKAAASALITWLKEKRRKTTTSSKSYATLGKLPKVISGKSAKPGTVKSVTSSGEPKTMTIEDRIRLKHELWK